MEGLGVRGRIKSCAVRPQEEGMPLARSIEKAIEDSKRCNIPTKRERLKASSQRRGIDETKSF